MLVIHPDNIGYVAYYSVPVNIDEYLLFSQVDIPILMRKTANKFIPHI